MKLSIIIVSWNVRDLLSQLIDSIFKYTQDLDFEIIVVDNDSKDGTVAHLRLPRRDAPRNDRVKIIQNNFNAGFSKANNQGLAQAQGKYVLFMNPDMELLENSFPKLIQLLEQDKKIGIATCRLLYNDRTVQPNVKSDPNFCSQFFIMLKLHHFLSALPCLKKYFQKGFDYTQTAEVQQAMGALILARRDLMQKVNGWDEDYWLWWEDHELCYKVREQGYKIIFTPETELIHYEGKSFSQFLGLAKQKKFNKGMLLYFKKRNKKIAHAILYLLQPLNILLTILTQIFKIKPRTQSKTSL